METNSQQELSWKVKSIWWKCVARVRQWCAGNFIFGVILYVWMIVKGYLYTYIYRDEMYHFLIYTLPAMIIIAAIGIGITYIGDEPIKIDIIGYLLVLSLCVSGISYFLVESRIGGHLTEYEAIARNTLAVWSVLHLITIIGVAYSKTTLKRMEEYMRE